MTFLKYNSFISQIENDGKLRSYPNRRQHSISKMCSKLHEDAEFLEGIPNSIRMVKKYWPSNRRDVNPIYSRLIYLISEYFQVYSVWVYKMIPQTNEAIKTVWHFGYKEDVMLAAKYIAIEINNLETIRFIRQRAFRAVKLRGRRKNTGIKTADARTKAIALRDRYLKALEEHWENALNNRPKNSKLKEKMLSIQPFILEHLELEYKAYKYKGKPNFHGAFCRKGKYRKNQVIVG